MTRVQFSRFRVALGLRIRKARWLAGKTQDDVAAESGIAFRVVKSLEVGESNPTLKTLLRLSEVLGISLDELLEVEPRRSVHLDSAEPQPVKRGRKPKTQRRR